MFERLKHFILESRRELGRVNWPTRDETMRLTSVVIAISLGIALFLGAFDFLFYTGVRALAPASAPIENASGTISSTTTEMPNFFSPTDVKTSGNGNFEITTENPTDNKPKVTPVQ